MSPTAVSFGDRLGARLDVVVDPRAIDVGSVEVRPRFGLNRVVGATLKRTHGAGDLLSYRYVLECLLPGCAPQGRRVARRFPPALVSYRTARRPTRQPAGPVARVPADLAGDGGRATAPRVQPALRRVPARAQLPDRAGHAASARGRPGRAARACRRCLRLDRPATSRGDRRGGPSGSRLEQALAGGAGEHRERPTSRSAARLSAGSAGSSAPWSDPGRPTRPGGSRGRQSRRPPDRPETSRPTSRARTEPNEAKAVDPAVVRGVALARRVVDAGCAGRPRRRSRRGPGRDVPAHAPPPQGRRLPRVGQKPGDRPRPLLERLLRQLEADRADPPRRRRLGQTGGARALLRHRLRGAAGRDALGRAAAVPALLRR